MAMAKKEMERLVFDDMRLTSVVPGKITGENKTQELNGIDLAMKLHYLNAIYFFKNNNNNNEGENININNNNNGTRNDSFIRFNEIKEKPLYDCLVSYFMACGRVRVSADDASDPPTIKLNDAGMRVVEARSSKTVEEWLAMEDFMSFQDQLVYNHGLGPDLPFSPLVCLQVTWFKCGGVSMGLSWAHVLGDAFSASEFMNMWSQYMEGHHEHPKTLSFQDPPKSKYPPLDPTKEPTSLKRVNPVGTHWVLPTTNCEISAHTIHLTSKQLGELHSKVYGSKMYDDNIESHCFEVISAIMWKSIAKIRNDSDTKSVTICRPKTIKRQQKIPYNGQILGTIEANSLVSSVDPLQLVHLISENVVDESDAIEELVKKEMGQFDFSFYGTNLTFVDMEEANVYGFKLKGNKPTFACYTIDGVHDKGAVMVLPGPIDENDEYFNGSKLVVLLLPKNEIESLKVELEKEWCIA